MSFSRLSLHLSQYGITLSLQMWANLIVSSALLEFHCEWRIVFFLEMLHFWKARKKWSKDLQYLTFYSLNLTDVPPPNRGPGFVYLLPHSLRLLSLHFYLSLTSPSFQLPHMSEQLKLRSEKRLQSVKVQKQPTPCQVEIHWRDNPCLHHAD